MLGLATAGAIAAGTIPTVGAQDDDQPNPSWDLVATFAHEEVPQPWLCSIGSELLAYGGDDGDVAVHRIGEPDGDGWEHVRTLRTSASTEVRGIDLSPGGERIAFTANESPGPLYQAETADWSGRRIDLDTRSRYCRYAPDGDSLAVGHGDGLIAVFETGTADETGWSEIIDWRDAEDRIPQGGIQFSPGGEWLAAASEDGSFRVYHVGDADGSGWSLAASAEFDEGVLSVDWHPDGEYLAVTVHRQEVRIYEALA